MRLPQNVTFPVKSFSVLLAITILTFGVLVWFARISHQQLVTADKFYLQLSELKGQFSHLDEVLTMSASMAASTGKKYWEERYHKYEPQLDSAIRKAYLIGKQFSMMEAVAITDKANRELVALEQAAFNLVNNKQPEAARAILESEKYKFQKEAYKSGISQLTGKISVKAKSDFASIHKQGSVIFFAMLLLLPCLLFFWYLVILKTRRYNIQRSLLIEALKKNDIELSSVVAAKDKLFSIIAHDLRGPFSAILGFSEMLAEDYRNMNQEELGNNLLMIKNASQKAFELLENLLAWSLAQTGKIDFHPEEIDLKAKIMKNIQLFQKLATEKGIHVSVEIQDNLTVIGDRNMTNTVLRNLLANAIKFTPEMGRIKIEAQRTNGQVEILVCDTGVGIGREDIPKLFDPLVMYSTKGTLKEKGTGLGLILCKEFVEKQGGCIGVDSEKGKGSTFRFSLPVGVEN